ncbi:hypothetical protein MRX96_012251 [Rhipicephalus microplus]
MCLFPPLLSGHSEPSQARRQRRHGGSHQAWRRSLPLCQLEDSPPSLRVAVHAPPRNQRSHWPSEHADPRSTKKANAPLNLAAARLCFRPGARGTPRSDSGT